MMIMLRQRHENRDTNATCLRQRELGGTFMVKEESMMFVPKATPGAQKILEEYLRKNKLEAHQLSPEQRNEL